MSVSKDLQPLLSPKELTVLRRDVEAQAWPLTLLALMYLLESGLNERVEG